MVDAGTLPNMARNRSRRLVLLGALLVAAGAAPAAASPATPDEGASTLVIPFERAVGDTYALAVTHEAVRDGVVVGRERHELLVTVRSPLGDGWVVEVRHQALVRDGVRHDLSAHGEAVDALRDELGGGVLRLRVDGRGTAERILNWRQVESALARTADRLLAERARRHGLSGAAMARARALLEASLARPVAEPILMADWNIVYAACGVRLQPGVPETRRVDVPRADGGAPIRAVDRRRLTADGTGGRSWLRFVSDVRFGDDGRVRFGAAEAHLTERAEITFDRTTRLLAGERVRTLRTPRHVTHEIVRFAEREAPVAADRVSERPLEPTLAPIAEARR